MQAITYRTDKNSTGNYIQYPEINHNGKEYKKRMYTYIYNWVTFLYNRN